MELVVNGNLPFVRIIEKDVLVGAVFVKVEIDSRIIFASCAFGFKFHRIHILGKEAVVPVEVLAYLQSLVVIIMPVTVLYCVRSNTHPVSEAEQQPVYLLLCLYVSRLRRYSTLSDSL